MVGRILIVEPDRETARDLFVLFHSERGRFERERYEVEIAQSVAEAVERAQTMDFHCVILDINLPEMNGYEAIPLINTISSNCPVIVTAAKNTPELETKVRQQGVYYYHLRSFGLDELTSAVRSSFERFEKVGTSGKPRPATGPVVLKQLQ
jgi:DNA-binding response OmpR family regulator